MRKIEYARLIQLFQTGQVFSTEKRGDGGHRQEEAFMLCLHELSGRRDPAAGDTDVDMRMERKLLAPGMEDRNDPRPGAKELFVRTKRKQRFLYASELQAQ